MKRSKNNRGVFQVSNFIKVVMAVAIIASAVSAQRQNFMSENNLQNWGSLSGAGGEVSDLSVHMTEVKWKVSIPQSDTANEIYGYADVIVGGFGEGAVNKDTKINITYSSNENLYFALEDGDGTGASYFAFLPAGKNVSRTLKVGNWSKEFWTEKYDRKSIDFRQDWWIKDRPEQTYDLDYSKINGFVFSIWSDDNKPIKANVSIKKFDVENLAKSPM